MIGFLSLLSLKSRPSGGVRLIIYTPGNLLSLFLSLSLSLSQWPILYILYLQSSCRDVWQIFCLAKMVETPVTFVTDAFGFVGDKMSMKQK